MLITPIAYTTTSMETTKLINTFLVKVTLWGKNEILQYRFLKCVHMATKIVLAYICVTHTAHLQATE